ncbi:MAG: hypothetical protein GEV11_25225 [Streptosporangiales bacterium]|nr:hypothetical protein [Streptosporangiales bacterium]
MEQRSAEDSWVASFAPILIVCAPGTWSLIKELTTRHPRDWHPDVDGPFTPLDECPARERADGALEIEMTARGLEILWRELRPQSPPEANWYNQVRPGLDVATIEAFAARVHAQLAKRILPIGRHQPDRTSPILIDM